MFFEAGSHCVAQDGLEFTVINLSSAGITVMLHYTWPFWAYKGLLPDTGMVINAGGLQTLVSRWH